MDHKASAVIKGFQALRDPPDRSDPLVQAAQLVHLDQGENLEHLELTGSEGNKESRVSQAVQDRLAAQVRLGHQDHQGQLVPLDKLDPVDNQEVPDQWVLRDLRVVGENQAPLDNPGQPVNQGLSDKQELLDSPEDPGHRDLTDNQEHPVKEDRQEHPELPDNQEHPEAKAPLVYKDREVNQAFQDKQDLLDHLDHGVKMAHLALLDNQVLEERLGLKVLLGRPDNKDKEESQELLELLVSRANQDQLGHRDHRDREGMLEHQERQEALVGLDSQDLQGRLDNQDLQDLKDPLDYQDSRAHQDRLDKQERQDSKAPLVL